MRHFTRGWANGELTDDECERASDAYQARLEAIASRLPAAICTLRDASLHDALIESVRWTPRTSELRVSLVAGDSQVGHHSIVLTYRGAMLGKQRIDSLRSAASNRDACVLYDEVDIGEDGGLVHRLLFWPNEEVTIDFRELEFESSPRPDRRVWLGGAFVVANDADEGAF